jgi:pimeloyl-ACP methyl ester carboxylesterase
MTPTTTEYELSKARRVGLPLRLRRVSGSPEGAPAVLLLHGGNTCSDIYLVPNGGLAGYLSKEFDVWLLDWRGSRHVTEPILNGPAHGDIESERKLFTVEKAAELDIPAALHTIRETIGTESRLGVVAWCLSGAVLSVAIAQGWVEEFNVSSAVLMTLGLFCEASWNVWLKAEDYVLERILHTQPGCRGISPHESDSWPEVLKSAYARWASAWLPPDRDFLRPLSFMVGLPFTRERLHEELRHTALEKYFGHLHLGFYLQSGQMVRRGFVAPYGVPDVIDRTRLDSYSGDPSLREFLKPEHFRNKRVTLINAAQNRVWHRDALDLMYEWLKNNGCRDATKHVMLDYNIMELIWGARVHDEVFDKVAMGLRGPASPAVRRGSVAPTSSVRARPASTDADPLDGRAALPLSALRRV